MPLPALVIDDDPQLRKFLKIVLEEHNWEVTEAESAERAFDVLYERDWRIIFCDVVMRGADGFSVLQRCREQLPATKVVLMTGHGNAAGALEATSSGAYEYLLKPFGAEELRSLSDRINGALKQRSRAIPVSKHTRRQRRGSDIPLVGSSESFVEVMKLVGRVASSNLPVLLTGESGTGKGVVAAALHSRSQRANDPFVPVNCAAIPAELIEAELFGHVKGAFTGADRDRVGLWEEADGGTVFLDEITETSPSFQVKLLRALQEGEIRRVGSNYTQKVDVRVVAASNRDVEDEVNAGRFRQDLFYRLNAVSIVMPPLRDRRDDILALVTTFAEQVFAKHVGLSIEALELLERYPWPGNIRELENAIVRAGAVCDGVIRPRDLPDRVRNYQEQKTAVETFTQSSPNAISIEDWPSMAQVEGCYVKRVMAHTNGNKQAAARLLSVDRKTLDRMIKRHNITINREH
ncbi:MAG TPA: sigma-54 dependent transcriptional regulator [Pyrinomonadaceae bacterium]|nr:sigma-54 dependent transcriptional regulator [Pyrinomonadaceae bacterium]